LNNLPPARQPAPNQLPVPGGEFALPSNFIGALAAPAETPDSFLRQYWRIFYKRRLIIAAITAACIALGLLIAMMTRLEYSAKVTVQVSRETAKVLNIEGVDADESTSFWDQEFYQTQYALLKSRSLSEAVVRDLNLADNYLFLAPTSIRRRSTKSGSSRATSAFRVPPES
jgi:succinoglycan biosynthesis transport protein ExoP